MNHRGTEKTTAAAVAPSPRWLLVGLVLAVVLSYANSLRVPFVFDDVGAVTNNPTIRSLSLAALSPPADGSTTTGRPLVNLSLAMDYAVAGESVGAYHVTNIAIHAVTALALFGCVRRTLVSSALAGIFGERNRACRNSFAFFAALLWALHPLQTETVVSVAQRTESLCGLFLLLTLYGFIRACASGSSAPVDHGAARRWQIISAASCLAGMASKEVMAVTPLLVLLYDRTFVAGSFAAAWRARRGYYDALATTWLLLLLLVLRSGGARGASAGFGLGITPWTYLLTQCDALTLYLKLTLWPHPLVVDYGTAVASSLSEVFVQSLLVLALLGATGWALVRRPVLGFLGAWFFVILAPSSSVVPLVTQTIAEHRMYLPLAAPVVGLAFLVQRRLGTRAAWVFGAVACVWGGMTFARNHDYRDAITLWSDTIAKVPTNPRAHNNLAFALMATGKADEADKPYARAVALRPDYVTARYNWGVALLERGRASEAVEQLQVAVRLAPDHVDAQLNLGAALVQAGRAAEAIVPFEAAQRLRPAADIAYNLGIAFAELGRDLEAATNLQRALVGNPRLPEAHFQLGRIAERVRDRASAEQYYAETLRLSPEHAGAHLRLGSLYARTERLPQAEEHLRAALRQRPNEADTHATLGNVLLLQSRPREAIAAYEHALRLRPDDARTRENLALARDALK